MASQDDEQFKGYLKSFRPLVPQALHNQRNSSKGRRAFAAAAGATVALAATIVVALLLHRNGEHAAKTSNGSPVTYQTVMAASSTKQSEIGTPVLTRLALEDPDAFNALMAMKLKAQFPAMMNDESTLRILAED
jgi:hypothetical protein